MATIEVLGFETSNNMKVRIALNYKDLQFNFRTIDPADRREVQALTRQPLTPVLRHGEVVLFDSGAIMRYLDANFPATPGLFSGDRQTVVKIEEWETFGRARLLAPMIRVVSARLAGRDDPALFEASGRDLSAAVDELTEGLTGDWLVGDGMTGADVCTAPVVFRALSIGLADEARLAAPVRAWIDRVMAYDTGS